MLIYDRVANKGESEGELRPSQTPRYLPPQDFAGCASIHLNKIKQIITDNNDPQAVAIPIGNNVSGNHNEVRYTPGILTRRIDMILCRKENPDLP